MARKSQRIAALQQMQMLDDTNAALHIAGLAVGMAGAAAALLTAAITVFHCSNHGLNIDSFAEPVPVHARAVEMSFIRITPRHSAAIKYFTVTFSQQG